MGSFLGDSRTLPSERLTKEATDPVGNIQDMELREEWQDDEFPRLRKNLKSLVIVHPTWYIKALMAVFKPFISSKFSQKVKFVDSLDDLGQIVPLQQIHIPACVQQLHQSSSKS
ncbi:putative BCL2-adenovirus E1B 19kD interacting protein [Naja naja]|nr:putative BCL2-adenovirus E1B 19kD interacting protein [Naja naja]